MSDPQGRPAPEYGEYATPEEVAAAMGAPAPPDPAHRIEPLRPGAGAPPPTPGATSSPGPTPDQQPVGRRWDQFVTVVLIVFGMWNVITVVPGLLQLDQAVRDYLAQLPEPPDVVVGDGVRATGFVLLAVWLVVYSGTIWFSWGRLRTGRLAFWVPLAGAAVTMGATFVIITVMFALDPELTAGLSGLRLPLPGSTPG